MENVTPETAWAWLLAAASAVVLLSSAAEKIVAAVKSAKTPSEQQNARIGALEKRLDEVDAKLHTDDDRLKIIEEGNRASQRALLALLDHGIDGNNIKQMQDAKETLQEHLINR